MLDRSEYRDHISLVLADPMSDLWEDNLEITPTARGWGSYIGELFRYVNDASIIIFSKTWSVEAQGTGCGPLYTSVVLVV